MRKKIVNKGDRYGYLEIVKEVEPLKLKDGRFRRKFELQCVCGNLVYRTLKNIEVSPNGHCGCKRKEIAYRTHGMTDTRIYDIWVNMKQRCYNKNKEEYARYGGRGITVCQRWLNSFEDFYDDVKDGYKENLTIDRYPNKNGNYEPTNFRWATDPEQQNNKSSNIYYDYNGEKKTLGEIGALIGVDHRKLWIRVKNGMSAQEAADLGNQVKGSILYLYNGNMKTLTDISKESGVSVKKLWGRMQYGHTAQIAADWGNVRKQLKKMPKRTDTLKYKCEQMGMDYNKVMARMTYKKCSFDEAIKYLSK